MTSSNDSGQELQALPDEPKAIVVGADSSSHAPGVIAMAARISKSMPEATVHVVHVIRTSRLDRPRMGTPEGNSDLIEDAKEQLAYHVRTVRKMSRSQVTGHFLMGDPSTELLRMSVDLSADMLIVGTHDHVGLERLLLGSVAESLMRKAPCPVLIVRPKTTK